MQFLLKLHSKTSMAISFLSNLGRFDSALRLQIKPGTPLACGYVQKAGIFICEGSVRDSDKMMLSGRFDSAPSLKQAERPKAEACAATGHPEPMPGLRPTWVSQDSASPLCNVSHAETVCRLPAATNKLQA